MFDNYDTLWHIWQLCMIDGLTVLAHIYDRLNITIDIINFMIFKVKLNN